MPIYVYEPTIYSEQEQVNECCYFETLQSMSQLPLTQCPTCGHVIHRAVTPFMVKDVSFGQDKPEPSSTNEGSSNFSSSAAKNAARLAARHLCGGGCRH